MKYKFLWILPFLLCLHPADLKAENSDDLSTVRVVLFPIRQAVLSSEVESKITAHKFREGESFEKGDVLIELDNMVIRERVNRSAANLSEAKAGVDYSGKTLERMIHMRDVRKMNPGDELIERSAMELEAAKAKFAAAESNHIVAQSELENCKIRAPFSGRVVRRLLQEHEYIRTSQQVIQIIDDNELLAAMFISSDLRGKVKIGDKVTVKIDETGTSHTGEIYEMAGEIDSNSRTFEIRVLLDNPEKTLVSGMAGVLVSLSGKDADGNNE